MEDIGFQTEYSENQKCLGNGETIPKQWGSGPWKRIQHTRFEGIYVLNSCQMCPVQTIAWPLQNHIHHWKGLAFRNSFWYAAKSSNSYSEYTLIGTLYSTHQKTHHKQNLFCPELCEVKVCGSCVNYTIFMEFSVWVKLAKARFSSLRPYILLRNA